MGSRDVWTAGAAITASRRHLSVLLAAPAIALVLGVPPVRAQEPPPLTGEFLAADGTVVTVARCGASQATITYSVTGDASGLPGGAAGPYQGTFTETGKLTLGAPG